MLIASCTDRCQTVKCGQDARQLPCRVLRSFGKNAGVDKCHAGVRDALARLIVLAIDDAATLLSYDWCFVAIRRWGAC